ncbi:MAG TPA: thioredoxin domain-containing protein [Nocardioides sp.]|uniref:DsbA family protein n=1 Tax=uncultured Nocardioides sp. TaxID=198441 RepID=UPI000EB99FC3|nr:thioredoxin domain-containing protein [uncultured Nocardioides sp.]HCB02771.1 disulfide bond formation protein DsbA [Nocardioides sp.]HRD60470.1 thioredoxin domain-containing protein [Nocardioides sp.]HRI94879.1 thioredoxin domain-containing protein [Nocardioides sp.]HRK45125.1 thioredoxin domain-containing protein [Nocardioides sp.]
MATVSNKEKQRLRAERAAAALKEKERRERRRQILTVAGVMAAVVLIIAAGFVINSMRDNTAENAAAAPTTGSEFGLTIGPDSAPHKVVIYEDFLCPYCGELEKQTHEELATLADEGKVQVEYRPIVILNDIGPYSARAAVMFTLVQQKYGDEAAKQFHDLLFANQPSESGPFPSREDLYALAAQAGADPDELKTAFEAGDGAEAVAAATNEFKDLGFKGTPTIIVDGKAFNDGRNVDELAQNLLNAVQ